METDLKTLDCRLPTSNGAQVAPLMQSKDARSKPITQITKCPTAIVYCEGNFGKIDGKTANGLVRHSQAYRILSVIDSTSAARTLVRFLTAHPTRYRFAKT